MKSLKISFFILLAVSMLISLPVSASETSNHLLNNSEIQRLKSFGFTEEELLTYTHADYNAFNQAVGDDVYGEVVNETTTYYKVTKQETIPVDENEAVAGANQANLNKTLGLGDFRIQALPSDSTDSGWLKMTLSVSKVLDSSGNWHGVYKLKNSWKWLSFPTFKLHDVVGITFNPNLTYIQDSEFAQYRYRDGSVGHTWASKTYNKAPHKSASAGIAFEIDMQLYGADGGSTDQHEGYMMINVKRNSSSATSTNAYGHYAHIAINASYSVSITTGSISVSGVAKKYYANDTAVSWSI
ncbi:hypothetical protein [Paenibacillus campi]|uniref:hypothetical protein n=1 Tax=Paenibacillus campi TaxID=3106031 RepID=UPI002AFEBB8D|nr:hypothetical protein [Paenibacillus sp. SGZ-1009]